jgi:V-type H+-transporting ATPase subunit a
VVERSKVNLFEKVLWRTLRGNVLFRHMEIPEPSQDIRTVRDEISCFLTIIPRIPPGNREGFTDSWLQLTPVEKDTFVVFFQGEIARTKIKKIAESFGAVTYPVPDTAVRLSLSLSESRSRHSAPFEALSLFYPSADFSASSSPNCS